jgi:4-amino-4-deoxy-L-arabinose transferase-like glycosyltransferase
MPASRTAQRYLLLALLVCGFAGVKLAYDPPKGRADGHYYMHLAQQVADGDGYTSRVSLYLQGYSYFPHPVNQSPAWISVLAGGALAMGMERASRALPEALYLLDLLLVYLLAVRVRQRVSGKEGWLPADGLPDFGHVGVLLLGANLVFIRFTALPYTEGQAFALTLGAFLALDRAAVGRSLGWAALAGVLAGLAVLTRVQTLALMVALPGVLLLAGLRERRFLALAGVLTVSITLPWLPWIAWLATWMEMLTPGGILGLATLQETEYIRPFQHAVVVETFGEYLLDRASGFLVAFHPTHEYSYTSHIGPLAWAPPVALVWFALRALPGPATWIRGVSPERVLPWAMLACAVGMLIPVHMLHGVFFKEWFFGHRHGLPLLFAVLPCLAWLDAQGRASRAVGATLLAASVAFMGWRLAADLPRVFWGYPQSEFELGAWLDAHEDHPVVITTRPQRLSNRSRRAYFHWMACREPEDQMLAMLRKGLADYVLVFEHQSGCRFARYEVRTQRLQKVRSFGTGEEAIHVFKPRRMMPQGRPAKQPR